MNEDRHAFQIDAQLQASADQKPLGVMRIYRARLIRAGQPNGWVLPGQVLANSVRQWDGVGVYIDHPAMWDPPSVRDLIGAVRNPQFNPTEEAIEADIHVFHIPQSVDAVALLDTIIGQREAGLPTPPTGLSAMLSLKWRQDEQDRLIVTEIKKVWSVDVVYEPAADGHVLRITNSTKFATMNDQPNNPSPPAEPPAPEAPKPRAPIAEKLQAALLQAQCQQLLDMRLHNSSLPPQAQADIRAKFSDESGQARIFDPDALAHEIEAARALTLNAAAVVRGMGTPAHPPAHSPRIHGMYDDLDQFTAAYERLMGLSIADPALRDVPRLTGIREAYHLLTGDRELRGTFNPGRVQFANANSTTLADLTRNVANKVVAQVWSDMTDYRWWERVVAVEEFQTLKQVSWITAGGFGDLPTVTEGASYPELTWDDNRETSNWLKRGGYLGLTLEMIDTDDTEQWRAVPRGLAIAALRTLSASVGNIFTQNSYAGPTLSDGTAMFHTSRGNAATNALNAANWDTAVQAVFKQSELSSGRRLALRPSLLLVPIELRKTGISLFTSAQEPGGNQNDVNVAGWSVNWQADNVIVSPELSSATGWFALVDPRIAPAVGVGFRFGRTPEIYTAADPSTYLIFHNDVIPIKVRYFYTVGVIDFRPAYRGNT